MAFEFQPHLEGTLVKLRPMKVEDFEALFKVASDPLIWEQHPNHDRWREDQFRVFFDQGIDSGGALVVEEKGSGEIIGSSRFDFLDEETNEVEIGWTFLARSHWGGSFNGDTKRLMLDHAFQFVDHVVFMIGPNNIRSRRAVERIGAKLVGSKVRYGRESVVYRVSKSNESDQAALSASN